jgi:hypothetical protein
MAQHLVYHGQLVEGRKAMEAALADLGALGPSGSIRAAVESAAFWRAFYGLGGCSVQEALAGLERSFATVDANRSAVPRVARARIEIALGEFYLNLTDIHKSKKWLDASLPILRAASTDLEDRQKIAWNQGMLAHFQGDDRAAVDSMRETIALLQELGEAQSPMTANNWYWLAIATSRAYGLAKAEEVLDGAPKFSSQTGDDGLGSLYPHLVALARVRIRLDHGDVQGAMKVLPGTELEGSISKFSAMVFVVPIRAELLCRTERRKDGQRLFGELMAFIRDELQTPDFDPDLNRIRATFGLCALANGDRTLALEMARAARAGLADQPETGSHFVEPLLALEQALKTRSPASSTRTVSSPSRAASPGPPTL